MKMSMLMALMVWGLGVQAKGLSAVRGAGETWEGARDRSFASRIAVFPFNESGEDDQGSESKLFFKKGSAYHVAGPFESLSWEEVPTGYSQETLQAAFEDIRDERFLAGRQENFSRRVTWLYPDDGCYARAFFMKELLKPRHIEVARIFIFGNLVVDTPNHPLGEVGWWYHTAPIVKNEWGEVFVFDPAIYPLGPLPVKEWILSQVDSLADAELSVCHGNTYDPMKSCSDPGDSSEVARYDIRSLLGEEWYRQSRLGRDPYKVLGDNPPWKDESPLWVGF